MGHFGVYAIAAPENIEKVRLAVREELERALKDGFTEAEVEAAKRGYLESLKVGRSRDSSLAHLLNVYMLRDRDVLWLSEWDKKIKALTPEQMKKALQTHIDLEKLTIVTAGSTPSEK